MQDVTPKRLTFTFDLEDSRTSDRQEKRYTKITGQVLDLLSEHDIRGTFFVVGELAKNDPELIRETARRGHEIACHSYDHTPIPLQTREQFKRETHQAKSILADLVGKEVAGYRAPIFSLTEDALWAVDCLQELGFTYSSSVLPVKSPLYGFPKAPKLPFRWPNGLLEIPAAVAPLGPLTLPYLGGIYLRYLPGNYVRRAIAKSHARQSLWIYCHPYDFDAAEPFFRMKGRSLLVSLLLWFNRKRTFAKVEGLTSRNANVAINDPFIEQIERGDFSGSPVELSLQSHVGGLGYTMAG
jgi:peptidoglycan-N-acetylglucosamine deacetylase